ncbi:MAG: DUF4249 family protein [Mariniphaga sp.]
MLNKLNYILFLVILFASCEEFYTPKIDTIGGQLVVDAQITNDISQNYVHLTKTNAFYSTQPAEPVTGAKVELVQIIGTSTTSTTAYESGAGNFYFSSTPIIGKNYKLRITILQDIYESEVVAMPPIPTISSFYTEHKAEKQYRTSSSGAPIEYFFEGRQTYIDAPITSTLSHYRFGLRSIMEWVFTPPEVAGPPPPQVYGWNSFYYKSEYYLAGPKVYSQSGKIEKQPLMMMSYSTYDYLQTDSVVQKGWIFIIDQFGTSTGSYDFHEKLNSQFAADGSLFDPVQTQIFGNITCKSDASKMVFGYFDLNSYRQYRYYMTLGGKMNSSIPRQINRYPTIPYSGTTVGFPPTWWE